jgi:hypothetical protein
MVMLLQSPDQSTCGDLFDIQDYELLTNMKAELETNWMPYSPESVVSVALATFHIC